MRDKKNHSPNHSFQTRPGGQPGLRSGFRILIGSPGRPGQFFFFFKSKQRYFSKKKKKSQRVATEFLTGSHRVFPSSFFSST